MPKDTPGDAGKTAALYRMVMPDHVCPFGLKSKDLLERRGYTVEDHHLKTRDETDAFKQEHGVDTTPQTFIDGARVGGYDDLRVHFDLDPPKDEQSDTSYRPVIAIFAVAALLALGLSWHQYGTIFTLRAFEWFVTLSMTILAVQKLQDVGTVFDHVPELRSAGAPLGALWQDLSLWRGAGRHPDDRWSAGMAVGSFGAFYRNHRCSERLQGRLY